MLFFVFQTVIGEQESKIFVMNTGVISKELEGKQKKATKLGFLEIVE